MSPCGWTVDSNKWQEPALESWRWPLAGQGPATKMFVETSPDPPRPCARCYYCAHLSLTLNTQHTAGSPAHLPINIKLYTFSNPGSNVAEYRLSWCGWSQSSCLRLGNNGHNCSTRPATSFRPSTLGTSSPPAAYSHASITSQHTHIVFNDSSFT